MIRQLVRNKRAWRLTLIALIVLPVLAVLPHTRSLVVRNAVTTTYLSSLKAPISGFVDEVRVSPGSVTQAGEAVVALRNDRVDGSRMARLEVLQERLEVEVEQLRAQLEAVGEVAQVRGAEYASNISSVTQDVETDLRTLDSRIAARAAALKEAQGNLERARDLYERDLLSDSDVEAAEAVYENARSEHSAATEERARLAGRLEEIQSGVFQVSIPDGVLLTRQASQDLDLEVMRMERALAQSEANLQATMAEAEAARASYVNRSSARLELPPGRTIWRLHATKGTWANEGFTLLTFVDCSRLMVDIAIDDATLELIEPGDPVRIRLFGSFDYLPAEVVLVRGSAALGSDAPALAAEIGNRGVRKGRVLARLQDSELAQLPGASCGIGRTAYAEFDELNLFELLILPLFR